MRPPRDELHPTPTPTQTPTTTPTPKPKSPHPTPHSPTHRRTPGRGPMLSAPASQTRGRRRNSESDPWRWVPQARRCLNVGWEGSQLNVPSKRIRVAVRLCDPWPGSKLIGTTFPGSALCSDTRAEIVGPRPGVRIAGKNFCLDAQFLGSSLQPSNPICARLHAVRGAGMGWPVGPAWEVYFHRVAVRGC